MRWKEIISVTIGNSVEIIGSYAFSGCSQLENVIIGNNVTTFQMYAFQSCTSLRTIIIPNSVITIGGYSFSSCVKLENVSIGEKVETISSSAFSYCDSLKTIVIPASVTLIQSDVFRYCGQLQFININKNNSKYSNWKEDGIFYDKEITRLIYYPIGKTNEIYEIPSSVTQIQTDAFIYCVNIKKVIIPNLVTSVSMQLFYGCENLENVIIGENVTKIYDWAFNYCYSLINIVIPNSVTSIESTVFKYCTSLKEIKVYEENQFYSNYYNDGILYNKDISTIICYPAGNANETYEIPKTVNTIGEYAFHSCSNLTNIIFPDFLTTINQDAFYLCSSLIKIEIPNSVQLIDDRAFYLCSSLESVLIGENVDKINSDVFRYCSSLKIIELPYVTYIDGYSFQYCTLLETVIFGEKLTTINKFAFYQCSSLKNVTIPSSVKTIEFGAFSFCISLQFFNVSSKNAYYSNYNNDGVLYSKSLSSLLFYPAGKTNEIFEIPNNVTKIYGYAFYSCGFIKNIIIPSSVNNIELPCFPSCENLQSFNVSIDNEYYTNYKNDGVIYTKDLSQIVCYPSGNQNKSFEILNYVSIISPYSFAGCSNLETLIIGENVTIINSWAFQDCNNLRCVIFYGEKEPIISSFPTSVETVMTLYTYQGSLFYNLNVIKGPKTKECTITPTQTFTQSNTFPKSNTFTQSNTLIYINSNITFSFSLTYSYSITETIIYKSTIINTFYFSSNTFIKDTMIYYEYIYFAYTSCYMFYSNYFFIFTQNEKNSNENNNGYKNIIIIISVCIAVVVIIIISVIVVILIRMRNKKQSGSDYELEANEINTNEATPTNNYSTVFDIARVEDDPFAKDFIEDQFMGNI